MQCVKQHSSYEYPWVPYLTSVKNSFIHHSFSHSYNLNVKLHVHTCLMVSDTGYIWVRLLEEWHQIFDD